VDVQGSVEPIINGLEKITFEENGATLSVRVLHKDVGDVTESDVMLASASQAIVVGFNVSVDNSAQRTADNDGVEIRQYNVIYNLFDDVEKALEGLLEPVYQDKVIGVAEVRQVFTITKVGQIAGSYIREGEARRDARVRVIRNQKVIHEDRLVSLKRFQEDVKEVRAGFECGIAVNGFNSFNTGDMIEFVVRERVR